MAKPAAKDYRRAGVAPPAAAKPLADRWHARIGLLLLGVALLTLSFAPFGQFYFSWVGLVPWLLVLRRVRSQRAAFCWSWLAGIIFFTANMWWLWNVTGPGMVALMFLQGLYWAVAALVIRGAGLLGREATPARSPLASVLLIASTWVAFEWLRGNYPLNGLPWLFLGHAQTPVLYLCQVADSTGVYGVSFMVAAGNAFVALLALNRFKLDRLGPASIAVATMTMVALGYGFYRMSERKPLRPGPTVMVLQPNYPQSNTGEKGAAADELVDYHVNHTLEALRQSKEPVDLVVWSETMMPPLNERARALSRGRNYGRFLEETHERLAQLARENGAGLVVGALYEDASIVADPKAAGGERVVEDKRNSAFFYDRAGRMSDDPADRYDKIHIVPFGEYLPFRETMPILHSLFVALSPYPEDYFLTAGGENAITVFRLDEQKPRTLPSTAPAAGPFRFVTPICFEDIDPLLVAKMFRHRRDPSRPAGKQADFIVNLTNDGWFKANQMPQHLQAARFRSIENRAPTARSVNTGISGFVDSCGRVQGLIPAGTEGSSVQSLQLDLRFTLYTQFGDVFAVACAAVTAVLAAVAAGRWWRRRRTATLPA
jgi:apolipoprotein N-acyltransferase